MYKSTGPRVVLCASVALYLIANCGMSDSVEESTPLVSLTHVGVEAEFGRKSQGQPDALLHMVLDAVLLDGGIAILDASAPYIRVFSSDGGLVATAVKEGSGPGEVQRPISLSRLNSKTLIVNEQNRIHLVSTDGKLSRTFIERNRYVRGATGACGGQILRLVSVLDKFEPPGAVTLSPLGSIVDDTLVALAPIRGNSMRVHPLLVHATDSTVLLYPEEIGRNRLLLVSCGRRHVAEILIDSVGRQEFWEPQEQPGRYALLHAALPRPAGVAQVTGRIIWAVQDEITGSTKSDSVTVFTAIKPSGERRSLAVRGWFQLVDSNSDRLLLISREPVSHALIIGASRLLRALDERGTESRAIEDME